ncbi:hypothetical protein, partial [Microvirga tunisiensis]
ADEGSASRPPAVRSSASQAVKAPSVLLNGVTHPIPTTFRHQTAVQLEDVLCDIKANRDNLRHDEWLLSGSSTCLVWHV